MTSTDEASTMRERNTMKYQCRKTRLKTQEKLHAKFSLFLLAQTIRRNPPGVDDVRSFPKSIRWPEHPCPNHNSVCFPRAYGGQSIHDSVRGLGLRVQVLVHDRRASMLLFFLRRRPSKRPARHPKSQHFLTHATPHCNLNKEKTSSPRNLDVAVCDKEQRLVFQELF